MIKAKIANEIIRIDIKPQSSTNTLEPEKTKYTGRERRINELINIVSGIILFLSIFKAKPQKTHCSEQ
jgi:hypothetical protein